MLSRPRASFSFAVALLTISAAAEVARAADIEPRLNAVRGYSWQGPYLGANLGYQWGSVSNNPANPSGFAGGLQGGYNVQRGQFVFGAETDIQISGADDRFAPWKFSNPWFGTVRGRAGAAFNNVLFYGTAGLAYGAVRAQNILTSAGQTTTDFGWVVGAGMEVALTSNWSTKVEYLYVDLGERMYWATGTSNALNSNIVRFGVNYRF